ncbi:MAG: hypothetical protein M1820_001940 [Bogoriella megaspora]|nr:MAG: hypothetical protein M1820_001940 [Bogoriella megaspora]
MEQNRMLAVKSLRVDVELALQTGSPTLFHSDAISVNPVGDSEITKQHYSGTGSVFSDLMLDVLSFASLLNGGQKDGRGKLDPLIYTELLVSLIYRLIAVTGLRQLPKTSRRTHEDVAHLATLAFMTTLLPRYVSDRCNYILLSVHLESAIQDLQAVSTDSKDDIYSLLLWTLFMAGISTLRHKDHRRLSLLIVETCGRLALYDWPAVRRQLYRFPWVYALHDDPGRSLWENSQRRSIKMS